jgi:hypothetical protein
MKIKIVREVLSDTETLGSMLIDGKFFAYTLEDKDRGLKSTDSLENILKKKEKGVTAIPSGTYTVKLSVSNRFKRLMPEILNVKGFAGIRMHGGNTHLDSEGCPLVARNRYVNKPTAFGKLKRVVKNWIQGSLEAQLTKAIQQAIKNNEEIQITITY